MVIEIYQEMKNIVLTMIEKETNKQSHLFVKDIKSITSLTKEIVDITGQRFILWKIIIKINTRLKR